MITIIILHEAYKKPNLLGNISFAKNDLYSVWITPKDINEDNSEDIDAFLKRTSIRVAERIPFKDAEAISTEIFNKFKAEGYEVNQEFLSND